MIFVCVVYDFCALLVWLLHAASAVLELKSRWVRAWWSWTVVEFAPNADVPMTAGSTPAINHKKLYQVTKKSYTNHTKTYKTHTQIVQKSYTKHANTYTNHTNIMHKSCGNMQNSYTHHTHIIHNPTSIIQMHTQSIQQAYKKPYKNNSKVIQSSFCVILYVFCLWFPYVSVCCS